jgi:O-antigen/teichoic acid export membrane protein
MDLGHKALFRNTVLNLLGLVVPLAVGFVAIPLVVRALGNERFGILSLVWVVFGYFGLFDLGLGRTTTKYIADALGRNEPGKLPGYLWTTVLLQTVIGVLAALLSYLAAPLIARRFLNIPPGYIGETILTLRLVGLSLPVMFVSSSFRGVLEAAQRFDLVNAVKVPVNVLFYVLPLAGVVLGLKLPGIVVLLVASRLAGLVLWARLSFGILPTLRTKPAFHAGLVRPLFSFSGWIGLSSILFAVTTSIDRLIIGAVITVEAVAFYSAPYEAINRVGVIPGSLGMVLFPAFSYLDAGRKGTEAESLFARSTKLLLLTTGPVFILLMFFARDFLRLWLGPDYAAAATLVVQVLAAGFFVNTVFAVPNNYLQGIGRADIAPKYQVVEIVVYGALAWGGAKLWGIKGVALATALRLTAFTLVLWVASFRAGRVRFGFVWRNGLAAVLAGLALLALGLGASSLLGFGLWGAGALCAAFAAGAWRWLLDAEEKGLLGGLLRSGRVGRKAAQEGG